MRVSRSLKVLTLLVGIVFAGVAPGVTPSALAGEVDCPVAHSGGYANCYSWTNPGSESARALSSGGLPYRFQLYRPSDGSRWGWWEWSDLNYHVLAITIAGSVTAQVDNRGPSNATYKVAMY